MAIEVTTMHIPHELQDEFTDENRAHRAAHKDKLYRRLASRYDEIDLQIYRIDAGRRANHGRGP